MTSADTPATATPPPTGSHPFTDNSIALLDPAIQLRDRLAALRTIGETPPPTQWARLAQPGEVGPAAAALMAHAGGNGWTARAHHAIGPVPYAWERRAAGHQLVASIAVHLRRGDRAAVAVWATDKIAVTLGAKPKGKDVQGPRRPPTYGPAWSWCSGWTWELCTCPASPRPHPADIPTRIGARNLVALVLDQPLDHDDQQLDDTEEAA